MSALVDQIEELIRDEASYEYVLSSYHLSQAAERIAKELAQGDGVEGTGFVIDVAGRLYMEGHHIGWLRKQAGLDALNTLSTKLGATLPSILADFKTLEEK